jgi:hypothetical protein
VTLELFGGDARTLAGIHACTSVTRLRVSHFRNLCDVSAIAQLSALHHVELFCCPELEDLEPLSRCRQLRSITIVGSERLKSVGFVQQLAQLESFTCELSTILDGDLAPLLGIPEVLVEHHRHYSHRPSQLGARRGR